jgi:hypothetical protein
MMQSVMYLTLIILVLLLPIPLYALFKSWYNKEKNRHGNMAVQRSFKEIIKHYRLTISEVNKFVNRLIAIDRTTGRVVIVVYKGGTIRRKCIGLEEIRACEIINVSNPDSGYIGRVTMEISLYNNPGSINFDFFDENIEDVRDLNRRIKQAGYWQKKIQYYLCMPLNRNSLKHSI